MSHLPSLTTRYSPPLVRSMTVDPSLPPPNRPPSKTAAHCSQRDLNSSTVMQLGWELRLALVRVMAPPKPRATDRKKEASGMRTPILALPGLRAGERREEAAGRGRSTLATCQSAWDSPGGRKVAQCCTSWENESDRAWVQILQKTSWQMGGVCESLDICHVSNANGDGVAGIPPFNFIDSLDGGSRTALRETN